MAKTPDNKVEVQIKSTVSRGEQLFLAGTTTTLAEVNKVKLPEKYYTVTGKVIGDEDASTDEAKAGDAKTGDAKANTGTNTATGNKQGDDKAK